ncbi:HVA22-like protein j [Camellia lanceoleosa]|nr:HVA22-like protein j [Camellia lanceoleosa]
MLGDFFTRGLVLVLGYAYPAFECFKTVEKNRVEIEELRFWCQYWIIVAVLTVFERIGDIFISCLPWSSTCGTQRPSYFYETFLRPYIAKHETEIDRKLQELRARAWDLAIYYWQYCTKIGQSTFIQALQYMAAQSGKITTTKPNDEVKFPMG